MVLDASITIAWVNEQETTPAIEAVFASLDQTRAFVPELWWLEVANALQMGVRRHRFSAEKRAIYLRTLGGFTITTDHETGSRAWNETLALSDRHNLTVYDAAYLELALRRQLPLATLDGELRTAAATGGVALLGA